MITKFFLLLLFGVCCTHACINREVDDDDPAKDAACLDKDKSTVCRHKDIETNIRLETAAKTDRLCILKVTNKIKREPMVVKVLGPAEYKNLFTTIFEKFRYRTTTNEILVDRYLTVKNDSDAPWMFLIQPYLVGLDVKIEYDVLKRSVQDYTINGQGLECNASVERSAGHNDHLPAYYYCGVAYDMILFPNSASYSEEDLTNAGFQSSTATDFCTVPKQDFLGRIHVPNYVLPVFQMKRQWAYHYPSNYVTGRSDLSSSPNVSLNGKDDYKALLKATPNSDNRIDINLKGFTRSDFVKPRRLMENGTIRNIDPFIDLAAQSDVVAEFEDNTAFQQDQRKGSVFANAMHLRSEGYGLSLMPERLRKELSLPDLKICDENASSTNNPDYCLGEGKSYSSPVRFTTLDDKVCPDPSGCPFCAVPRSYCQRKTMQIDGKDQCCHEFHYYMMVQIVDTRARKEALQNSNPGGLNRDPEEERYATQLKDTFIASFLWFLLSEQPENYLTRQLTPIIKSLNFDKYERIQDKRVREAAREVIEKMRFDNINKRQNLGIRHETSFDGDFIHVFQGVRAVRNLCALNDTIATIQVLLIALAGIFGIFVFVVIVQWFLRLRSMEYPFLIPEGKLEIMRKRPDRASLKNVQNHISMEELGNFTFGRWRIPENMTTSMAANSRPMSMRFSDSLRGDHLGGGTLSYNASTHNSQKAPKIDASGGRQVKMQSVKASDRGEFINVCLGQQIDFDTLLNINHVNLEKFYGFWMTSDQQGNPQIFAVMNHEQNVTLVDVIVNFLQGGFSFGIEVKNSLLRDLCAGLAHLHSNNIVHGHLHPACCTLDPYWRIKISDWNLSFVHLLDYKLKMRSTGANTDLNYRLSHNVIVKQDLDSRIIRTNRVIQSELQRNNTFLKGYVTPAQFMAWSMDSNRGQQFSWNRGDNLPQSGWVGPMFDAIQKVREENFNRTSTDWKYKMEPYTDMYLSPQQLLTKRALDEAFKEMTFVNMETTHKCAAGYELSLQLNSFEDVTLPVPCISNPEQIASAFGFHMRGGTVNGTNPKDRELRKNAKNKPQQNKSRARSPTTTKTNFDYANIADERETPDSLIQKAIKFRDTKSTRVHANCVADDVFALGLIILELYEEVPFFFPLTLVPRNGSYYDWLTLAQWRPEYSVKLMRELSLLIHQCFAYHPKDRPNVDRIAQTAVIVARAPDSILKELISSLGSSANAFEQKNVELQETTDKVSGLLTRMFPKHIITALMIHGETPAPQTYYSFTCSYMDIVGFTTISSLSTPKQIVRMLNELYLAFDKVMDDLDVYKMDTIGDCYVCTSGVPNENNYRHAREIIQMALCWRQYASTFEIPHEKFLDENTKKLRIRQGVHSGPGLAIVLGYQNPKYMVLGNTVAITGKMEAGSKASEIQVSQATINVLCADDGDFADFSWVPYRNVPAGREKPGYIGDDNFVVDVDEMFNVELGNRLFDTLPTYFVVDMMNSNLLDSIKDFRFHDDLALHHTSGGSSDQSSFSHSDATTTTEREDDHLSFNTRKRTFNTSKIHPNDMSHRMTHAHSN